MRREEVIWSGEQRVRGELTELSLQNGAELNPGAKRVDIKGHFCLRGQHRQRPRAVTVRAAFQNSESAGVAAMCLVLSVCTAFGFCSQFLVSSSSDSLTE